MHELVNFHVIYIPFEGVFHIRIFFQGALFLVGIFSEEFFQGRFPPGKLFPRTTELIDLF